MGELPGDLIDIRKQVKQSINTYNRMRPHMSCDMLTPVQMHAQDRISIKTWRNEKAPNNQVIT